MNIADYREFFVKISISLISAVVLASSMGCKNREFSNNSESNLFAGRNAKLVPFNAYNIWRDGAGAEILDYPKDFDVREGKAVPDGVHFVEWAAYLGTNDANFIGVPTTGAKVVKDVLEYPVSEKTGKALRLKFSNATFRVFYYDEALSHCKENGMRLPTIRELFDFCAAGVSEPNYGPDFDKMFKYPQSAPCYQKSYWSASLWAEHRGNAWMFEGYKGTVATDARFGNMKKAVRCVTTP
jgi:hypothetical protein